MLLNSGIIHRVGAHRLNVKLARHLAAQGFTVLRFDLAGLGDSSFAESRLAFEAQLVEDIRAALNILQNTTDAQRFIVGGICSGADNGYSIALADKRVIGTVMLDPYVLSNAADLQALPALALSHPAVLLKLVREKLAHALQRFLPAGHSGVPGAQPRMNNYLREQPAQPSSPPISEGASGSRRENPDGLHRQLQAAVQLTRPVCRGVRPVRHRGSHRCESCRIPTIPSRSCAPSAS